VGDEPEFERRAVRQAERRGRYRRRRLTALAVVGAGLVGAGALLAGFVFAGGSASTEGAGASASTTCEPAGPSTTVKPRWWTARRQTVLVDSVLLGGTVAMRSTFKGWKIEIVGKPAIMLPAMEDTVAARRKKVARLVVIGIGYNSLWERGRRNYSRWAAKFDKEAKSLLAALRRKGARQFVWVTLRQARRSVIPSDGLWQHNRYAWYFPYVNERLKKLAKARDDLVVARWDKVSNRKGLTYDAIHLNPRGATLMANTIKTTIQTEGKRQTKVVPPPPGDCA
jgi:lysophospholipase L1-like esterase